MPCYRPVTAYAPLEGGSLLFVERKNTRTVKIACGQCIGCRIAKREGWAFRCYAESRMHEKNCFLTLTYDPENLPRGGSLDYTHVQRFFKRLRKKVGPFRYFVCGEYGEAFERPHYHALLFGVDFDDKEKCNSVYCEYDIYRSGCLESVWPFGFSSIGEITYATARYCAAYVCKRVTGPNALDYYQRVDSITGEIVAIEPEFARMSLKPGIGESWLKKYWPDVYSYHDAVIMNGRKQGVPRYFDKKIEEWFPDLMEGVKAERMQKAIEFWEEQSPERLATRETVEIAKKRWNAGRRGRNYEAKGSGSS